MKKILIIGMTSGVGGVETFITNLIEHIDKEKFQIELLIHQDINEKYLKIIEKNSIKVHKIIGIKKNFFIFLKEIITFFKKNKFDIVHVHECSSVYFLYYFPIFFKRKIKLIIHSHNGDSKNKIMHYILRGIQNIRTNIRIACSDIAGKWMFGNKDFIIIHNGIELDNYKYIEEKRIEIREKLGIKDEYVIGSIARFEEQKNHKKIVDIFSLYVKEYDPNAKLILVGSGSLKNEIKNYVDKKNINFNVIFLDIRNDIADLLMGFDLFLLPSKFEGLPFVAVESQASSLPILASDTVSNQINMTDLVFREKLEASENEWCKKIVEIKLAKINRVKNKNISDLTSRGYNIKNVIFKIEEFYLS